MFIFNALCQAVNKKMRKRSINGSYENWSNFLTKGNTAELTQRWQTFDELQKVLNSSNRSMWREFAGDVLVELMKLTTPEELSALLVKKGYLDLKEYLKVTESLGLSNEESLANYQALSMESKK